MKEYGIPIGSGFLLSFTLGWGDLAQAFILGIAGAAGGMLLKLGLDWVVSKWKNRNKKVSK